MSMILTRMKPNSWFMSVGSVLLSVAWNPTPSHAQEARVLESNLAHSESTAAEHQQDVFPLAQGTQWVYEGPTRWSVINSSEVREARLTWTMEVIDTIQRNSVTAAILKGHPAELAWYEEGKMPGEHLIVQVGEGKWYLVSGQPRVQHTLARLKDEQDTLQDLVTESELFLEFPLTPGTRFGTTEIVSRTDGWYCWLVTSEEPVYLGGLPGIRPAPWTRYQLRFQTLPDHTIVEFVPGVGITRYTYRHHGTVAETNLQLIDYHHALP